MYCPNCGAQNVDTNRFCLKCGGALPLINVANQPTMPMAQVTASMPASPTSAVAAKPSRKPLLAVTVLIAIGLIAIAAVVVLNQTRLSGRGAAISLSITPLPLERSGQIAFGNYIEISIMNADGTNVSSVTTRKIHTLKPAWSPDGRQLAYVSYTGSQYQIFLVGIDGSNFRKLSISSGSDDDPTWSPDSKYIAFRSTRNFGTGLYVAEVDGIKVTRLTNGLEREPAWSPDGQYIAYRLDRDIYIMQADGSQPMRLISGGQTPAWSRDGLHLAYVCEAGSQRTQICIANADGSNIIQLTDEPNPATDPAWSPDGTRIAYRSANAIFVTTLDGTSKTKLLENLDDQARGIAWSPLASALAASTGDTMSPGVGPTHTPALSSTETPTAIPTDTPTPTITPTPTPCPDTSPYGLSPNQMARLGCAAQGFVSSRKIVIQRFERGVMIIFAKPNNTFDNKGGAFIYALTTDGRVWRMIDSYIETSPNRPTWYSCDVKSNDGPEITGVPWRGFGKAWCSYPDVRQALGRAVTAEEGDISASFQSYETDRAFQVADWRGFPGWKTNRVYIVYLPTAEGNFIAGSWEQK